MEARSGIAEIVASGIRRVLAPNPSPYTSTGTQVHLIGERELAIIDPGPDLPGHLNALLEAIGGRQVSAILITHNHRDHSPMSRPLAAATGATIVGCAPLELKDLGPGAEGFDADYRPDRVLADGETLEVDGRVLVALATPGHTSNHLCFADEAAGVLFSGDHVMGWSTSVVIPPDGAMDDYVRSLQKLQGRRETIYYPGHGEPVPDPQRLLRGSIGHRLQRDKQIARLVAEGRSSVVEIVEAGYPGLDVRLRRAAGATVWAHLIGLAKRGIVRQEGNAWTTV